MPIYEYRCPNGHLFELFQRMDEPAPAVCEVCDTGPVEKVLHPVPIIFRGRGFYTTDYGSGRRKRDPAGGGGEPVKASDSAKKPDAPEPKKAEST